jgi:uncharacterized protein (TIGR03492 family)
VNVAEYGPFERSVLRRADTVFVRDDATAQRLTAQGVDAFAPGNVMVDLWSGDDAPQADQAAAGFVPPIAVFPGSREHAYEDASFALEVVRRCTESHPRLGAIVSLAPMLDASVFARRFEADGWTVDESSDEHIPFSLRMNGGTVARAWRGPIGPVITRVQLVLGQAGTANEAAASAGVPIVAFERSYDRKTSWYRMRQHGLLGDALLVLQGDVHAVALGVVALLDDPERRVAMGHAGRQRMGAAGGARAIARSIADALA